MSRWTSEELNKIGKAEELKLASVRSDGSLRRPVTMWVVRLGDDLYVRSVRGRTSSWFRGAQTRHEAHVQAGDAEKDVDLVEIDDTNDDLDRAYRAKYGDRYASIVPSIVTAEARSATLRLEPHEQ